MTKKKASAYALKIPLRITHEGKSFFGPGKTELLELIGKSGSISKAAESMGMSYAHAWKLVREMNAYFREPLVESVRGGVTGGGATVTANGQRVLTAYRAMQAAAESAAQPHWDTVSELFR